MNKFRLLRADEIECRVGTVKEGKGFSILLYKDARCDMKILDETVGAMNWQKSYSRDNANCTVSIWDDTKNQWISKEDTGTESKTESEKGLASDSFKRACFNWGIGRELYTAPFIWITGFDKFDRFEVSEITYDENGNIKDLEILEAKTKGVAFSTHKGAKKKTGNNITPQQRAQILAEVNRTKCRIEDICTRYKVEQIDDLPVMYFESLMKILSNMETR